MELTYSFIHVEQDEKLERVIEKKMKRVLKLLNGNAEINWSNKRIQKGKQDNEKSLNLRTDLSMHIGKHYLYASTIGDDLYKNIDVVLKKIRKQLEKRKGLIKKRIH